ncbi:hypothetical protein ACFPRL_04990 [Pseudoclavibacter helvolus]
MACRSATRRCKTSGRSARSCSLVRAAIALRCDAGLLLRSNKRW